LNIIFIPIWEGSGAALSTVISYAIATFSVILFDKTRNNGLMMLSSFNIYRAMRNI
jgi:PST family polysaccharide transporter